MSKLKIVISALILSFSICLSSLAAVDSVKFIKRNAPEISDLVRWSERQGYEGVLSYRSDTGLVYFSNSTYNDYSSSLKEDFMTDVLFYIRNCGLDAVNRNKLYSFIEDQDGATAAAVKFLGTDTSADLVTATNWLRPFSGGISTFLGVMAVLIFLFLGISSVMDIAYLVIPVFSAFLDRNNDNKKPFLISNEAWKAKRESESAMSYESPLSIYLKYRFVLILVVGVSLLYLISGQIYDLMSWFITSFGRMFSFS